ncbi:MAG: 50S ribosomal protein L17 [Bacteroidetes bacterium]|nr:50S ribosomal protein L17 [Bacteroidota bacterium]
MRHGNKINKLGRTHSHRVHMLANMATSLILHKRITTTVAKAKALRVYVEPMLNKAKDDSTHSRRTVFSYLQSKEAVTELFREIAVKIADRPGGYTRILKTGTRLGDNADMCIIELVDYNENLLKAKEDAASKSTRRKRSKKKAGETETAQPKIAAKKADAKVEATPVIEEAVVVEEPVTEEVVAEETPEATEETPAEETNEKKEE